MDYTTRKALSNKVICAPDLPPKPTGELHILGLNGNTFCVNGTEIGIFKRDIRYASTLS
jgi:hypothetical protein